MVVEPTVREEKRRTINTPIVVYEPMSEYKRNLDHLHVDQFYTPKRTKTIKKKQENKIIDGFQAITNEKTLVLLYTNNLNSFNISFYCIRFVCARSPHCAPEHTGISHASLARETCDKW